MKRAQVKKGEVYAYSRRQDGQDAEPALVLAADTYRATGHRAGARTSVYWLPDGGPLKVGRWSYEVPVGLPLVQVRSVERLPRDDRAAVLRALDPDVVMEAFMAHPPECTSACACQTLTGEDGPALQFGLVTVMARLVGPWDEVAEAYRQQREAERAEDARRKQLVDARVARARRVQAVIERIARQQLSVSHGTYHGDTTFVVPLGKMEAIALVLEQGEKAITATAGLTGTLQHWLGTDPWKLEPGDAQRALAAIAEAAWKLYPEWHPDYVPPAGEQAPETV